MTFNELIEHPERASEDDLRVLENLSNLMKDMKRHIEVMTYGVTEESGHSKEEIAKMYYTETMLMSAILEAFVFNSELEYKEINKFVFNFTDKGFMWDLALPDYFKCLSKLCSLELLKIVKEDKYNPVFAITDYGNSALRQQTYANLAQTALFNLLTQQLNDKSLALNERAVRQNRMMLYVAVASAVVAVISVLSGIHFF